MIVPLKTAITASPFLRKKGLLCAGKNRMIVPGIRTVRFGSGRLQIRFRKFLCGFGRESLMGLTTWLLDHSKYLALVLGVAAGFPLVLVRRKRLEIKTAGGALLLSFFFTVLSLAATMLLAALESLLAGNTPNIGAVSVMGVYLFAPFGVLAAAKVCKWKKEDAFDLYTLYALPSLFLMRINCLISGCCIGRLIGSSGLRWPTREAEMGLYVVLFIILLLREKEPRDAFSLPDALLRRVPVPHRMVPARGRRDPAAPQPPVGGAHRGGRVRVVYREQEKGGRPKETLNQRIQAHSNTRCRYVQERNEESFLPGPDDCHDRHQADRNATESGGGKREYRCDGADRRIFR